MASRNTHLFGKPAGLSPADLQRNADPAAYLTPEIGARWVAWSLGLSGAVDRISQRVNTTVQATLNLADLRELPVPIPPEAERHGIAGTLGALDDKIQSNRRLMDVAAQLARAHVEVSIAGRQMVPYNEALEVRMGSAFKGDAFSEPGVGRPLLRIRDLKTFESQTWTTEVRRDEIEIRPGDIVVGMDAEFRPTLWLGEMSVLNQRVCSFAGKPGVGRAFVLAALEPELTAQENAKTGTTVIHLNKADIETFVVPHLTNGEHERLSEVTEPLMDQIVARSTEIRILVALRDALMPELLSGRIPVPGAPRAAA